MTKKPNKKLTVRFYLELAMAILAVLSVVLLAYEYIFSPNQATTKKIAQFDLIVALIFLTDFLVRLTYADNKVVFLKTNWFLLLASIPIVDSWAEILRGLRVLALVRLIRAGEHLEYVARSKRH